MRTYVLWEGPNVNLLIDERKIEEKILLGDNTYELSWDGLILDEVDVKLLNKEFEHFVNFNKEKFDEKEEMLVHFFGEKQIELAIFWADELVDPNEDRLVYDLYSNLFYRSKEEGFLVRFYEYWDGHNWRPIVFDSNYGMVEKIIKVADSYIDLDQFDGRNWSTGNPFEHVRIHKIIQMDNSTLEDHYIAICTSDYQGIHPWGIILESKQELRKYLEVNYRDQYYNELISL